MNEKIDIKAMTKNAEMFTEQLNALNLSTPTSFDILTLAGVCIELGKELAQGEA